MAPSCCRCWVHPASYQYKRRGSGNKLYCQRPVQLSEIHYTGTSRQTRMELTDSALCSLRISLSLIRLRPRSMPSAARMFAQGAVKESDGFIDRRRGCCERHGR